MDGVYALNLVFWLYMMYHRGLTAGREFAQIVGPPAHGRYGCMWRYRYSSFVPSGRCYRQTWAISNNKYGIRSLRRLWKLPIKGY
ncbi:hypothetical protein PsorP6_010186 [Peronosclerospora sorghi]|uniref:Uncharacterized protein n=1 Tax=Peronosclerospora sorghi TaxID=230839 RepID=A0ACC0VWH5_9STRA|nr:hypothetical protein PsorP6_010186 [Peronosclerospora sorghi]